MIHPIHITRLGWLLAGMAYGVLCIKTNFSYPVWIGGALLIGIFNAVMRPSKATGDT